ncbi:hypothetical protein P9247_14690 [Bacillus subtilis]|nr:hypothetical protein [Bacillus subtilis]
MSCSKHHQFLSTSCTSKFTIKKKNAVYWQNCAANLTNDAPIQANNSLNTFGQYDVGILNLSHALDIISFINQPTQH